MKKLCAAFVTLLLALPAFGQQATIVNGKAASMDNFSFKWENDTFAGTDKWYTNGLEFNWTLADVRTWDTPTDSEAWAQGNFSSKLPDWAQFLVSTLPFSEDYDNNQYRVGFSFGQNMYTPANIRIAAPQPNDRPWAGWLYLAPSFIVQGENRMDVFELSFGVVGSWSGAEATQKFIHDDILHTTQPMGWSNQLANEFAFNLSWQRYWRYQLTDEISKTFGADFVGNAGFTAGNVYVYGNAGFMFRAGYNIPHDYGTSLIRPAGTYGNPVNNSDPRLADSLDFSIYGFAGTQQYIMGRNIFLQGNTFANSASIGMKNWVGDFSMGIGATTGPFMCNFTMNWRSNEFDGESGGQWFGSLNMSVLF
ncbi:lipid A deacylase LpxR family protein [Ruficoccus amylovorans]|uniref:Lipid A deacylase LpxR family protein n=1 Tax=Ruficoccus amylovorans TaxID=1804625 RepID=A0A842HJ99_9BACT|nr:lipid A deacylase LpxR family protein [Ruficoccus amylovorans]MBC2595694.1 lipid A deacylase LpxR family protein [Ruficoccus amylovorans]